MGVSFWACRLLFLLPVHPSIGQIICDLSNEIAVANAVKMVTVRMMTGTNRTGPRAQGEKPAYEVAKLSDLFGDRQDACLKSRFRRRKREADAPDSAVLRGT